MSTRTKKQTTAKFTEFIVAVPKKDANKVQDVLWALLPAIGVDVRLSNAKDTDFPPLEELVAEIEADDKRGAAGKPKKRKTTSITV